MYLTFIFIFILLNNAFWFVREKKKDAELKAAKKSAEESGSECRELKNRLSAEIDARCEQERAADSQICWLLQLLFEYARHHAATSNELHLARSECVRVQRELNEVRTDRDQRTSRYNKCRNVLERMAGRASRERTLRKHFETKSDKLEAIIRKLCVRLEETRKSREREKLIAEAILEFIAVLKGELPHNA